MIDFIPVADYTPIFNYAVLVLIILTFLGIYTKTPIEGSRAGVIGSFVLMFVIIVYMGLRPISSYFGDTINYASAFSSFQYLPISDSDYESKDWLFRFLMIFFAKYADIHSFFLFCATVYVGALWYGLYRFFGNKCYLAFLVALSMFTFWSYGVNGVRNGMASSLVILALSFRPRFIIMGLLSYAAISIHQSLLLTVGAAILASFYKNSKVYLATWCICIVISFFFGNAASQLISSSGLIPDERFESYLNSTDYDDQFSQTGFRWDFLLYSAIPIAIGFYFIYMKGFTDKIYTWIYNIYLTVNAFWIIVIEASFSNRFAQISWFIMPIVLIYPFLNSKTWPDQSEKAAYAIVGFYLFTFYMNFVS